MISVKRLPPSNDEPGKPDHHVGSPPTSFINPWPSFDSTHTGGLSALKCRFARDRPAFIPVPDRSELVAVRKPDWGNDSPGAKVTWIGHASFLIETSRSPGADRGIRILCDPVFSERTSPVSFIGPKRYTPTPCALDEVPDVDVIITSHSHYDHCDINTIKPLYQKRQSHIHFIAALGNAAWYHNLGIPTSQVTELDWWDAVDIQVEGVGSLRLTCTPTQHFSSRSPFDRDRTLWCSYVIEERKSVGPTQSQSEAVSKKIFFAGDTGYRSIPRAEMTLEEEAATPHCPAFAEIGKKFGPFDLALLPIGLCSPRTFMSPVHCNPWDSIDIHRDIQSKKSVGMHWGTVRGGLSQEYEDVRNPPRWWKEATKNAGLRWRGDQPSNEDWNTGLMDVGETIILT